MYHITKGVPTVLVLYENIRRRREELGISQEELANMLGYKSRSSINKIEKGINDIPQSKIVEFARALKTTPEGLMGWKRSDEKNDGYYTDPETAEIANALKEGDGMLRVLFDAARDLPPEKMKEAASYIQFLKAKQHPEEE